MLEKQTDEKAQNWTKSALTRMLQEFRSTHHRGWAGQGSLWKRCDVGQQMVFAPHRAADVQEDGGQGPCGVDRRQAQLSAQSSGQKGLE